MNIDDTFWIDSFEIGQQLLRELILFCITERFFEATIKILLMRKHTVDKTRSLPCCIYAGNEIMDVDYWNYLLAQDVKYGM